MSGITAEAVPLLAVVGPTGSGKSALALALAEYLGSEIFSVDSMQFYRGMEIGTAAPSPDDRRRVPHHFVSFLDPDEEMSAGHYQHAARDQVRSLNQRGKCAVAAGGSGMYVSALIDGIFDGPGRDPAIRDRLREEAVSLGNAGLLARLREVDPDYAAILSSANDLVRIIRALEVYELTATPYSVLHRQHRKEAESLHAVQFALHYPDREALYLRINARVLQMVDAGWVTEVQALVDAGYAPQLERLKALGFREMMTHLRGEQSLDAAIAATQLHHRRYAKRQLSWFNADPRIHWIPAGPGITADDQLEALLHIMQEHRPDPSPKQLHRYLQTNASKPSGEDSLGTALLASCRDRFESARKLGEGALDQLAEDEWHRCDGPEDNSIAVIIQHLHGNMLSRWTDFLTADGEKASRDRDGEFMEKPVLSPEALRALWDEGWSCVRAALAGLTPEDLLKTVTIRQQPLSVLDAINRQLGHYHYHVGQIVYLARHYRGSDWKTLSIARGASTAYKARPND